MSRVVALLLFWLGCAGSGQAFVRSETPAGVPLRWNLSNPRLTHTNVVNPVTRSVRYFIGSDTYSAANQAGEIAALRNSFRQWQAIPGTTIRFEEGGLLPGTLDVNTLDNTNVIFWARSSVLVNNQRDSISGATGMTFFDYFGDGSMAEVDIVLNGVQYGWTTDHRSATTTQFYVETIATHEVGHLLGLHHSPLGAATMFTRGSAGKSPRSELSSDEWAAALGVYPAESDPVATGRATLNGLVTLNGAGVFGAMVVVEDRFGNMAGGTVTRTNGQYSLPGLPAGEGRVRVVPLDPATNPRNARLVVGTDIARSYAGVETAFLPTADTPVTLKPGATVTLDLAVQGGTAPFRITRMREPTTNPDFLVVSDAAYALSPGQSGIYVGVYSPNLPASNATLAISGSDLVVGPPIFRPGAFTGLNLISVLVNVPENAVPGLRTLTVRQGGNVAHAHGFLKILPRFPDINLDGLDDGFQRDHFTTPFAPAAAPGLDPDQDGFSNAEENIAGSNPTDAASVLRIESIRWDLTGATIRWRSAPGRRYQVSSRLSAGGSDPWRNVGDPVVATGDLTAFVDTRPGAATQLYRVTALP